MRRYVREPSRSASGCLELGVRSKSVRRIRRRRGRASCVEAPQVWRRRPFARASIRLQVTSRGARLCFVPAFELQESAPDFWQEFRLASLCPAALRWTPRCRRTPSLLHACRSARGQAARHTRRGCSFARSPSFCYVTRTLPRFMKFLASGARSTARVVAGAAASCSNAIYTCSSRAVPRPAVGGRVFAEHAEAARAVGRPNSGRPFPDSSTP